jgi:hypothetical protein
MIPKETEALVTQEFQRVWNTVYDGSIMMALIERGTDIDLVKKLSELFFIKGMIAERLIEKDGNFK